MLHCTVRNCLRIKRHLHLAPSRVIFSPIKAAAVSSSVSRQFSVSSLNFSDAKGIEELLLEQSAASKTVIEKSELELLFEPKEPRVRVDPVSDPAFSHAEADPAVFGEGAGSLLSSAPVEPSLGLAELEPAFTSLGLAHWWPSGWLQTLLEILHIDAGEWRVMVI